MSAVPAPPRPPSAAGIDLFELPGIRSITRVLRRSIMANRAARLEGKILLYTELGEAMHQGVPVALALQMCAQTVSEYGSGSVGGFGKGAESRWRITRLLYSLFYLIFGHFTQAMMVVVGGRLVDAERIARLLAARLFDGVNRGVSLSGAMRAFGNDFDSTEAAIIALGEQCGNLPDAVARLAEYQKQSKLIAESSSRMAYPAFVFAISYFLLFTLFWKVVPRFVNIFESLGAELNPLTGFVVSLAGGGNLMFAIICFPAIAIMLFTILRSLLNGNPISAFQRAFFSLLLLAFLSGIALRSILKDLTDWVQSTPNPTNFMISLVVIGSILFLAAMPFILSLAEFIVLRMEDALGMLAGFVPILRGACRRQDDARWLAAFSTATAGGMALHEAARAAGATSRGRMAFESRRLSDLLEKGVSLPEALRQTPVVRTQTAARLGMLEGRPNFSEGLIQLASDEFETGSSHLMRTYQICSLLSLAVVGLILGLVVISLYLPLFSIPFIVR